MRAQWVSFAKEYVANKKNGTQAAINAGYSPATANQQASRLLTKVNIQAYITELENEQSVKDKKLADKLEITRESQLADLQAVKEKALADNQYNAVIRAIETQNKMLGFNDPTEQRNPKKDKFDELVDSYTVEELRKIVDGNEADK